MSRDIVGRPMELLLVEDSHSDAGLTINSLRGRFNHRVTMVMDVDEAEEFLQRRGRFARAPRPDLILLDLGLPRRSGRELLSSLRRDETLGRIPVVVLAASPEHETLLKEEGLRVEAYLVKPVDWEQFLKVVLQVRRTWWNEIVLPRSEL